MAAALRRYGPPVALALLILAVGGTMLVGWQRYNRDYVVTPQDDGTAVTQVIAERFAGASSLKVSDLSGTIQSTASDVRGFGFLKSDQVVKMPFSVDYFVDVGRIGPGDLEWVPSTRTLIVNAPDVKPARANVDEGRRTLVRTGGIFVTRAAAEELSRRVSVHAQAKAEETARAPERMAQARENGRVALARLMGAPLATLGYGDARVVVTFPPERRAVNREQWDVTRPLNEVLAKGKQGR
ncbi:MAG: hypothetical protein DI547_04455 [Sphingobium sp.]|nr:MAG: hypothetical protein DI547_04455 [Sphingobium sp.]